MTVPKYPIQNIEENRYAFASIGIKGVFLKVVAFDKIGNGVYNLGFGDYNFDTDSVDDKQISDNGDMKKVLATVVVILHDFLAKNPAEAVYISGSTPSRTRLYQIAINTYFDEFSDTLEIFGQTEKGTEVFRKNVNYESFLIRKLL